MSPRGIRALIAAAFLIAGGAIAWWIAGRTDPVPELPPLAETHFRNAAADVEYVGMDRCITCHAEAHASYRETAHSQALDTVRIADEPPDGEFEDPKSQRFYRIHRTDQALYHEESIRTTTGERVVLADLAVSHVIGSGRFSRSYLIERDGFLYESPATWYAQSKSWGLSPGYERSNRGFTRPAEARCLSCHAGRIEPVDHSPQRVTLHALSIDCERCHGPGALHVARWEPSGTTHPAKVSGMADDTIVNPARLTRERHEDICAQCHLHGAAAVELRGRSMSDYRPGGRLADYVVHFGFAGEKERMQVVGHVEQMRLSRCWQNSETLTCTTCHDPHAKNPASDSVAGYREKCLSCHALDACGIPQETRTAGETGDNCMTCHMPRGPTEIPHFAFNHHRIGIHREQVGMSPELDELAALSSDRDLPEYDRMRNRGIAWLQSIDASENEAISEYRRRRALEILEPLARSAAVDADLHAALARLWLGVDAAASRRHAESALAVHDASPEAFATANYVLGILFYQSNQFVRALPFLERTATVRPTSDVWMMLSDCRELAGVRGTLDAARRGAELAPDRPRYVEKYAKRLIELGDLKTAAEVSGRVGKLWEYRQRIDRQ